MRYEKMKKTVKAIVAALTAGYVVFCDEMWKYRNERTMEQRRVFK